MGTLHELHTLRTSHLQAALQDAKEINDHTVRPEIKQAVTSRLARHLDMNLIVESGPRRTSVRVKHIGSGRSVNGLPFMENGQRWNSLDEALKGLLDLCRQNAAA